MSASTHPQFFRVRQTFARPRVEDVASEVERELARLKLGSMMRPGASVAITAGSRGIANIAIIIRAIAAHLTGLGAKPFIVPAMGSHGGGTAEGQREVIESFGITERFCGCPIRASMETVEVGRTADGLPVYFDRQAFEADHVLVCGRVKPHTHFAGDIESGLMKMMALGLGKHEGAKLYHRAFQDRGFGSVVRAVCEQVLAKCRILAGLGIVENGYDETARIEAMLPQDVERREIELLKLARQWMARLPFEHADILIVDEMGKNISGSGMDTNVVGRKHHRHEAAENEFPKVRRIIVRSLSEATRGNAYGIGTAEFCTTRLIQQIDERATWINGLASCGMDYIMRPMHFETDREVLDIALPTIGLTEPSGAKVLWIKNTLQLAEVECSAAYIAEAQKREDLEILTPLRDLPWDPIGNLPNVS